MLISNLRQFWCFKAIWGFFQTQVNITSSRESHSARLTPRERKGTGIQPTRAQRFHMTLSRWRLRRHCEQYED